MVASRNGKPKAGEPRLLNLNEAGSRKLSWLWHPYVPLGELTVLVAPKDAGKSTFGRAVAADVTGGPRLPGNRKHPIGSVLWFPTEEDFLATVRPKLLAAGANCDWVFGLEGDRRNHRPWHPVLPRDLPALAARIKEYGVRLCVFDVLVSHFADGLSMNSDQDVRSVLEPLVDVARETQCAILGIVHPNKSMGRSALDRVSGAGGWVNVPRAVLGIRKESGDENRRRLIPLSTKIPDPPPALLYGIERCDGGERIVWQGPVSPDAGQYTDGTEGPGDKDADAEAEAIIAESLKDGPRKSTEVLKLLDEQKVPERVWRRVKATMGAKSGWGPSGKREYRTWYLPPERLTKYAGK